MFITVRIQSVGDNSSDVEIVEEHEEKVPIEDGNDSPPVTPISSGPYIPISECFTGRSPILEPQVKHSMIQLRNYYIIILFFTKRKM